MPELVVSIVVHAGLGIALAGVIWGVGLGWLALFGFANESNRVFSYPFGLVTVTLAAFLLLLSPWLAVLAAPLLVVPAGAFLRRPLRATVLSDVRGRLAWALPGAIGLPLALGLLLHAPTTELDSRAYGDMLFYVAKLVSAEQSVVPFRDLLVEGEPSAYVEAASSFIGAALALLPGFDPFLFQTTTLPASLLASVAFGVGLLGGNPGSDDERLLLVGLLAVALVPYPSWLTESPPMALALPLTFAVYRLARERVPLGHFVIVAACLAVAYALTKGFTLIALVVVAASAFARDHLRSLDARRLLVVAAAAVGVILAVLALLLVTSGWLTEFFSLRFLPADAARGLVDQFQTRDTQALAPAVEVVGTLLLGLLLFRIGSLVFLAVLVAGLAGHWLVGGHGFDVLIGTAVLLAALVLWQRPALLARNRRLALATASVLTVSAWFRDVVSVRAGFVLVSLLVVALVGAFAGRRALAVWPPAAAATLVALAGRPALAFALVVVLVVIAETLPRARRAAVAIALAGGVALAAASGVELATAETTLTPAHVEIWRETEDLVPRDGLVFTSLTGPVISGEQGWNYYPGVIARQIYVAGWSNSVLLVDEAQRARRLRFNADVLRGRRRPRSLPLDRSYSSYFAVIRTGESAPESFLRLYANSRFALYRIRS